MAITRGEAVEKIMQPDMQTIKSNILALNKQIQEINRDINSAYRAIESERSAQEARNFMSYFVSGMDTGPRGEMSWLPGVTSVDRVSHGGVNGLLEERKQLLQDRRQYQQRLYELEKADILASMDDYHPLQQAVISQFAAMDETIKQNAFLPCYVDIAMNTRLILSAPTSKERHQHLDHHLTLAKNAALQKKVAGALLTFAGVAILLASLTVALTTFGVSTPLSGIGFLVGISLLTTGGAFAGGITGLVTIGVGLNLFNKGVTTPPIPKEVIVLASNKKYR